MKVYLHQRLVLGGISLEKAQEKKAELASAIAISLGIGAHRVTVTAVSLAPRGGSRRLLLSFSDRISVMYVVESNGAKEENAALFKMKLLAAGDDSGTTALISYIADKLDLDAASIKVVSASKSVPSSESTPTAEVLDSMVSGGDSSPSPEVIVDTAAESPADGGLDTVLIAVIIAGAAAVVLIGLVVAVRVANRGNAPSLAPNQRDSVRLVGLDSMQGVGPFTKAAEGDVVLMQYNNPGALRGRESQQPQHHTRDSTQLPAGWDKHNTDDGKRYYSDRSTQKSQWEPPVGSIGGSASCSAV